MKEVRFMPEQSEAAVEALTKSQRKAVADLHGRGHLVTVTRLDDQRNAIVHVSTYGV